MLFIEQPNALVQDADIIAIKCLYYAQQLRADEGRGWAGEARRGCIVTGQLLRVTSQSRRGHGQG